MSLLTLSPDVLKQLSALLDEKLEPIKCDIATLQATTDKLSSKLDGMQSIPLRNRKSDCSDSGTSSRGDSQISTLSRNSDLSDWGSSSGGNTQISIQPIKSSGSGNSFEDGLQFPPVPIRSSDSSNNGRSHRNMPIVDFEKALIQQVPDAEDSTEAIVQMDKAEAIDELCNSEESDTVPEITPQ